MTTEVITMRTVQLHVFRAEIDILEACESTLTKYWYYLGQYRLMEKDVTDGTNKFTEADITAASNCARAAIIEMMCKSSTQA